MTEEKEYGHFAIALFVWGIIIGFIIMATINTHIGNTHKQGQIDALNKIVKYKKETQKDSTVIWVEIKQNKK